MKRFCFISIFLLMLIPLFASCANVTIPNSAEAKEKMEALGYTVQVDVQYGEMVAVYNIDQVTILTADKGDDFIQVYFFTNQEDTDTFYKDRARSLTRSVEVARKNKYSIYRGTQTAVDDFLSE